MVNSYKISISASTWYKINNMRRQQQIVHATSFVCEREFYSSLQLQRTTRQPGFAWHVRFPSFFPEQVIQPRALRLNLDSTAVHNSEVQPRRSIPDCADLIRNVRRRVLAHLGVQRFVRVKIVEVFCNGVVIAHFSQVSGFAVLDLEGYTTSTRSNDGYAGVKRLGYLDFEPFAQRELESDLCIRHEGVQDCRRGRSAN